MHAGELRATLRVVLPYVVVAGAWIFFSDAALLWLTADPLLVNRLQSLKGLLFVLVTAALLLVLLQRELQRRRSTEAALSESQRFAAQMADALPGLLFLYDFAAQRHVYVSQGLTTILGYTPDQIAALGDGALPGLIHPDDWRAFAEGGPAHYAGLRDGQMLENNFRVRHADGSWRWLHSREVVYSRDAQGQPQRFLGVALDISHQRAAEEQLRESERRFRALTEASPAGIFRTDAQGQQTYVNERWCEIMSLTAEQGLGTGLLAAVHPADREQVWAVWTAAVAAGRPAEAEFRLQLPDRSTRWVLARAVDERDEAGALSGFLGTVTDVTGLKRAEARAQRLARVYAVLSDINQVIVRVRERGRLFEAACRTAVEAGGFRMAWIGLADQAAGRVAVMASAGATGDYLERLQINLADEAASRGPVNWALRQGHSAVSNDVEHDDRLGPWRADAVRQGYRAIAAFPLVVFGEVLGTFALYADEPGFFDAEEIKLLDELAQDLSFALEFIEREIQRRQMEAALQASEARFRTFFEQAPVYCYMLTPAGVILDANAALCAALGYTRAELVGTPASLLYAPPARARAQAAFEHWQATGQVQDEELIIQARSGAERTVLLSASAVRDAAGQVLYSLSVQRDITDRVQAEAALRESETRYRQVVDQSPVGIVLVQAGRLVFANPALARLLGAADPADLVGRPAQDFVDPETWPVTQERLARIAAGQSILTPILNRYRRLDGQLVDVEVTGVPSTHQEQGAAQVMVQDVTERRRAEAALRESEARYRLLAEHMADVVWLLDVDTQRFKYVSPSVTGLLGYSVAEVLSRTLTDLISDASLDLIRTALPERLAAFQAGDPAAVTQRHEVEQLRQDGSPVWTEVLTTVLWNEAGGLDVLGVSRDIVERKRAEAALRESEARYRNLIDHAPDAIFINRDNRIVLVNAAALRLFGAAAPAQLLGRAPYDLFHADDHAAIRERIRRLVELAEPALPREERIVRVDGSVVDVEVSAAPFQDQGLPAIHVILRDITERKRAAEELRQAQDLTQLALGAGEIGIWRNDLTTGQVYLDKRARAHYGVDRSELPLAGILERVHSADRERLAQEITAATAPTSSGRFATEYRVVHPDASEHWLAVGVRVWFEGTGPERRATMGFGTSQDITERKRQAAASARQLAMLDALYTQAHQLAQTLDPVQVAASVVRQCGETFGARLAWLGVAEPDGRVEVLAHFPLEDDYPRQVRVRWDTAPEGFGPTGRALRERAPVISTDQEAPTYAVWRSATAQRGFRASAAFPLVSREQPLGALNLYSDQPDFFSAERVALFQAFAQQAAAALANARLFQAVSEQREQLRGLAARVAEVEESERRSLARELHDRVGANLTALNISLTIVRGRLSAETLAVAGPRLDDALTLLQETMVQVRDVMMDLRPSVLDDYGLLAALRWYAQQLGRRSGQTVLVANAGAEPRLPAAAETALFRVAQEALTNVIKHARAAQAEVRLETDAGRARLVIADDGVGFDPGLRRGGWGMVNMRERVEAVGGRLHVESQPGRGAMITVEVDL